MHELSLAGAIVAIAEEHAAGGRVSRVEVRVGQLRQVVPRALAFAFELVAEGTRVVVTHTRALVMMHATASTTSATTRVGATGAVDDWPSFLARLASHVALVTTVAHWADSREESAEHWFDALHRAVEDAAREADILVLAGSSDEHPDRERELIDALRNH